MKSMDPKNEKDENPDDDGRLLGILVLLTVPLSWGTYAPVVKYVYEMEPPLPGFVFSAGYYAIASVTLTFLAFMMNWKNESRNSNSIIDNTDAKNGATEMEQSMKLSTELTETQDQKPAFQLPLQTLAGIELGSYLFIGNCLQVIGLKTVPADRAAFLVQLTTVMVPCFSAVFAGTLGSIPLATWIACILAFAGVLVMGLDRPDVNLESLMSGWNTEGGLGDGLAFSGGDLLITLAAISYTMHVIRLGRYAKFTDPLNLAASKATVEAFLSTGLVVLLMSSGASNSGIDFIRDMSSEIQTYFTQIQNAMGGGAFPPPGSGAAFGACLWTGWITCAYTIYAQSFGQRRVSPTDANLIYTMQPIFSSLFAFFLLGESLGTFGFGGASLILFALWVVTNDQSEKE